MVGLRLNTISGGGIGPTGSIRYEAICPEMGWHLQPAHDADPAPGADGVADRELRVPEVVDRLGDVDVGGRRAGSSPTGSSLLELVRDGLWTKLSGAYRLSTAPGYTDTVPFARALAEAAPDRCLYGSDWPHLGFWGPHAQRRRPA